MGKNGYYAVNRGRQTGIYDSWNECESNVKGYSGATYKKFNTYEEARSFSNQEYSDYGQTLRNNDSGYNQKSVVYTDGASSNNGKYNARAGYGVYWGDNDSRNTSERLRGNQTNQRAELTAVNHALKQSQGGYEPLEIRTDSSYAVNGANNWSKNWVKNDWRTSSGTEVKNRDLFEEMIDLVDSRPGKVDIKYVPGHKGYYGNEQADLLATQGSRKNF